MVRVKSLYQRKNVDRPMAFVRTMWYLCKQNAIPIISIA